MAYRDMIEMISKFETMINPRIENELKIAKESLRTIFEGLECQRRKLREEESHSKAQWKAEWKARHQKYIVQQLEREVGVRRLKEGLKARLERIAREREDEELVKERLLKHEKRKLRQDKRLARDIWKNPRKSKMTEEEYWKKLFSGIFPPFTRTMPGPVIRPTPPGSDID